MIPDARAGAAPADDLVAPAAPAAAVAPVVTGAGAVAASVMPLTLLAPAGATCEGDSCSF